MRLSSGIAGLWKQMIQNLNDPDWASRHLAEEPVSPVSSQENLSEPAYSGLEIAMRQMGLLSRPQDSLLPPRMP